MDFQLHLHVETVGQCHSDEPLCLSPEDSVGDALRAMKEHNQAAVLICQDQLLVGIFTERDALRMMADGAKFDVRLDQVMTRNPGTVSARETVGRAIAFMSRHGYRRLPIVDDQRRPVGMIKVEGILRYLVEHFPAVIYNLPPEPHQVTQEREGA